MRALHQGAPRRAHPRAVCGTHARRRPRRGGPTARTPRLIGAILAGGASTRFGGEPKGLHRVAGRRIIDRVADALREVTSDFFLVSNAGDAATWLPGVATMPDARAERGSLIGIHTAVSHARARVLVVAWDMPFVTPALLTLLEDRSSGDTVATVPEGPRRLEPLCAVYSPGCLAAIDAAIDDGDFRLSSLLERLPSYTRVPSRDVAAVGDPARLFFNVNSAADLAAAERLAARA